LENLNSKVKTNDHLYIIGDFCFGNPLRYLKQIRCKNMHLIVGSHDKNTRPHMFSSYNNKLNIKLYNGLPCVLNHECMRVWDKSHYFSCMLHGHSHSNLQTYNLSFDVGVDGNNFFPYSEDDIIKKYNERLAIMRIQGRVIVDSRGRGLCLQDDLGFLMKCLNIKNFNDLVLPEEK